MADKTIPNFDAPKEFQAGIFFQFYIAGVPYIRLNRGDESLLPFIERILKGEFNFQHFKRDGKKVLLKGDYYEVIGAGVWFTRNHKRYELHKMSSEYVPDREHGDRIKSYLPEGTRLVIPKI